jgi:large subunit ribosomal protein L23
MKFAQDVIVRPVITENSMSGIAEGKYTFEVAMDSNKNEIAEAVEKMFPGVKVAAVNTMHVGGKQKRMGRSQGVTKDWKKAIVTVTKDSKKIEFFESMM